MSKLSSVEKVMLTMMILVFLSLGYLIYSSYKNYKIQVSWHEKALKLCDPYRMVYLVYDNEKPFVVCLSENGQAVLKDFK